MNNYEKIIAEALNGHFDNIINFGRAIIKITIKIIKLIFLNKQYESYSDVPFFRRQWFFWSMILIPIFSILTVFICIPQSNAINITDGHISNFNGYFFLTVLIFGIISFFTALTILIFGNIYFQKDQKVLAFNMLSKLIAGIIIFLFSALVISIILRKSFLINY